ncbi:MAG TPA: hypothetical protein VMV82_03340 [Candidatus Dormibacteraeota bacterium]|nr:hypothetical protein [Candidatus Dormibacteraeota bacterium]
MPDPRVSRYWGGSNDLGTAYEHLLPVAGGPAWDVYMFYAPGVAWDGATPPKPSFRMHQLRPQTLHGSMRRYSRPVLAECLQTLGRVAIEYHAR